MGDFKGIIPSKLAVFSKINCRQKLRKNYEKNRGQKLLKIFKLTASKCFRSKKIHQNKLIPEKKNTTRTDILSLTSKAEQRKLKERFMFEYFSSLSEILMG